MPETPPKPCIQPGCHTFAVVGKPRCAAHMGDYDRRRKDNPALRVAQKIRSNRLWQKVRLNFRIANPLCCDPFGDHALGPEPTQDIHHVLPLATHPHLAYTDDNLRPLCRSCHCKVEEFEYRGEITQHLFTE